MKYKKHKVLLLIGFFLLLVMSSLYALTASNTVPPSRLSKQEYSITANQLKPSACDGLNLDIIITNGNGSTGHDLILGTAGSNNLTGGKGNNCLVGGDGDDALHGGSGTNVCIGGAGVDSFYNCDIIIDP